mmetsp:Transcript_21614/g.51353  ORF Transcript_21614/g.51353 Transcript_21614/m.51353 type:complete len:205 (+) Transcript_21614:1358-1972(+)
MERPDPLRWPSAPRAKTKVGRWTRSLMRDATMPTTPSWKSASNSATAGGRAPCSASTSASSLASARSRMPLSISRRSRLIASSWVASSRARTGSSVVSVSMPRVMSASRPAALMRGPSAKPRSKPWAWLASRLAALKRAITPGWPRPARMRLSPWATRRRLLASSRTTSATVPRATRSSRPSRRGSGSGRAPRLRSSARRPSST